MKNSDNKPFFPPADLWIVLVLYAAMYALDQFFLGAGFSNQGLLDYTHYLNPQWLQDDLSASLWYLHSQPPVMNFLIGIVFKITPEHYLGIFEIAYFIAGAVGLAFLFFAMARLGAGRNVLLGVCGALCVFPTFFIYGTWLYSTHLEFCLCAALAYFLAAFYTDPQRRLRHFAILFSICCILGLIRGQWHLVVFFGLAVLMAAMEAKPMRAKIALISALCLLPLAAWYAKNEVVFGFFGPSSWMGSNLAQVAAEIISPEELAQMKAQHQLAPDFPALFDMDAILHREPAENITQPALAPYKIIGVRNLNYAGIIPSARQDMQGALAIIEKYPLRYVGAVAGKMWKITWKPSLSHRGAGMTDVYSALPKWARHVLEFGAFLLYGCIPAFVLIRGKRYLSSGQWKFVVSSFYLVAAMWVISCALNGEEQVRMRWGIAPFYLCYAAIFLEICRSKWLARKAKTL